MRGCLFAETFKRRFSRRSMRCLIYLWRICLLTQIVRSRAWWNRCTQTWASLALLGGTDSFRFLASGIVWENRTWPMRKHDLAQGNLLNCWLSFFWLYSYASLPESGSKSGYSRWTKKSKPGPTKNNPRITNLNVGHDTIHGLVLIFWFTAPNHAAKTQHWNLRTGSQTLYDRHWAFRPSTVGKGDQSKDGGPVIYEAGSWDMPLRFLQGIPCGIHCSLQLATFSTHLLHCSCYFHLSLLFPTVLYCVILYCCWCALHCAGGWNMMMYYLCLYKSGDIPYTPIIYIPMYLYIRIRMYYNMYIYIYI